VTPLISISPLLNVVLTLLINIIVFVLAFFINMFINWYRSLIPSKGHSFYVPEWKSLTLDKVNKMNFLWSEKKCSKCGHSVSPTDEYPYCDEVMISKLLDMEK
jgi:hypothetical protein